MPSHIKGLTGFEHGLAPPVSISTLPVFFRFFKQFISPAVDKICQFIFFEIIIFGQRKKRNNSGKGPGNLKFSSFGHHHLTPPGFIFHTGKFEIMLRGAVMMGNPTMQSVSPTLGFHLPNGVDPALLIFIFPIKLSIPGNCTRMAGKKFCLIRVIIQCSNGKHWPTKSNMSIHCFQRTTGSKDAKSTTILNQDSICIPLSRNLQINPLGLNPDIGHSPAKGDIGFFTLAQMESH